MTDWVIHRQFLRTKRQNLNATLGLLPAPHRGLFMKEVAKKPYGSALRYYLRERVPSWPDAMIEDFASSILAEYNAIRNARGVYVRKDKNAPVKPFESDMLQSRELINRAFRYARPSGCATEIHFTTGKTGILGAAVSGTGRAYKIRLSPAYKRLIDKIGVCAYRHNVILNGFLVLKPFDDASIWCCEVEDTKKIERKTIYLGRYKNDTVGHSVLASCLTALEKVVAQKCIAEMRGED